MVEKFNFLNTYSEDPHFGTSKFCHIIIFCYIYLSWKLHASSLSG